MGDNSFIKALALATQLGFAVACPLVFFVAGGAWADGKLHTAPWLFFLGLALGLGAAGAALYQIATSGSKPRPGGVAGRTGTKHTGDSGDTGTNPANDQRTKSP